MQNSQVKRPAFFRRCLSHEGTPDVKFYINEHDNESTIELPVHAAVLSLRSPVFQEMFYGPISDRRSKIKIYDVNVDASALKACMRALYTLQKDPSTEIHEDCGDACLALYIARIYNLDRLFKYYSTCVQEMLNWEDAQPCKIYELAFMLDLEALQKNSMEYIAVKRNTVMFSKEFLGFSYKALSHILARDDFFVEEKFIFDAAVRWAVGSRVTLDFSTLQTSAAVTCIKEKLGTILYKIRFPLIPATIFDREIRPTGILNENEIEEIELLRDPSEAYARFSNTTFKYNLRNTKIVLEEPNFSPYPWTQFSTFDTIYFSPISASHGITLHSLQMKNIQNISCIKFQKYSLESFTVTHDETLQPEDWNYKDNKIEFQKPIKLEENLRNAICIEACPQTLYSGVSGISRVKIRDFQATVEYMTNSFVSAVFVLTNLSV